METGLGAIHMRPPVSWEEAPSGERSPIRCYCELRGEHQPRVNDEHAARTPAN